MYNHTWSNIYIYMYIYIYIYIHTYIYTYIYIYKCIITRGQISWDISIKSIVGRAEGIGMIEARYCTDDEAPRGRAFGGPVRNTLEDSLETSRKPCFFREIPHHLGSFNYLMFNMVNTCLMIWRMGSETPKNRGSTHKSCMENLWGKPFGRWSTFEWWVKRLQKDVENPWGKSIWNLIYIHSSGGFSISCCRFTGG